MVCVNRFNTDTQAELDLVVQKALSHGAFRAVVSEHWAKGGEGAVELAKAVVETTNQPTNFKYVLL